MNFIPRRLAVLLALTLAAPSPALAQAAPDGVAKPRPVLRRGAPHTAVNRQAAMQLADSFDVGDAYATPNGPRKLLRLADAIAVSADAEEPGFRARLTAAGTPLAGFKATGRAAHGISVLKAPAPAGNQRRDAAATHEALLKSIRATDAGKSANPVFIDPATGLRLLATSELIVRLRAGADATRFFGEDWTSVQPLFGTTDQFVLTRAGATAEEILAAASRLAARAEVEWAEPNFILQTARNFTPNDPLLYDQWHLRNDGQFGGSTNAQVHVTGAWDITLGSSNVVVAILDDGVQIDHPDLAANIFSNPGEIANNGVDDDANGFIDDTHGWDFFASDNNPSPAHAFDNHGTALAGLIAGVGDNALGISGAAPRCRVLPLKIITGEDGVPVTQLSRVLHYAAGFNLQGQSVWRGADIINISLTFARSFAVDAALKTAATKGRGGRGCAIFAASGNSAGAWVPFEVFFEQAGTYTLRWEFTKDENDVFSIGADTAWLDNLVFPNGTVESFEGGALPPGWTSGGAAPWQVVTDGVNGNRALTGWTGPGSRSLRAGRISHNQVSWVQGVEFVDAGFFRFWAWTESEAGEIDGEFYGFDVFHFIVDGNEVDYDFGVPILQTNVGYPASHASVFAVGATTDFDFRADFSQFGAALDFVAPSDGGNASISTTDRTGTHGYNSDETADGDYAHDFGGTSAATPLAAGVAALALSANPYLSLTELGALLRATSDHIGGVFYDEAGFSPFYGYGRLNAARAVARARPNLNVTIKASPNPVVVGDITTYTISVRNNGTSLSGPVSVTNRLPAGVALGAVTPAPASRNGSEVVFNTGNVGSGVLLRYRIVVTNLAVGTNVNVASAGTDIPESTLADNTATSTTRVVPVPLVSIGDATATEADAAATNAVFPVTLSNPSSRAVTVRYAAVSGAATRGRDFAAAASTLRFAPGETSKSITVRVLPDRLDEDDENFFVNLSVPVNATIEEGQGIGRILDNDPLPSVSITNVSRLEGNVAAPFRVRLSAPSGRPVSVSFETASASAAAGADFIATNGTLVFPPGRTLLTLPVRLLGDSLRESNETFLVTLSAPNNATLGHAQAAGTIVDNDPLPRLFISDASVTEGNDGTTNLVFQIRLSAPSALTAQVSFFATNGTATAGTDFMATNGTVQFLPGETNQTVSVAVIGDAVNEANETCFVRLIAPLNAALGDGIATGTILNDDPPLAGVVGRLPNRGAR